MDWHRVVVIGTLIGSGCTFETATETGSAGLGGSTGDGVDSETSSASGSDTTTGASGSGSSDGPASTGDASTTDGPDPTSSPQTSTDGTTGSAETGETGETGVQTDGPQIEISGDAFGTISLGSSTNRDFMITNAGDEPAQMVQVSVTTGFTLSSTDCPATLEPKASCGARVVHAADALGLFEGDVEVSFDGGMQQEPISADVVGETGELVTDGGFESCPDGPWQDVGPGSWVCGADWVTPHSGAGVLASDTGPSGEAYVYRLQLDLTPYANAIATGNMEFEFRTWARTWSTNDDEYRIRVRYRNQGGQNVEEYDSAWQTGGTWVEYDDVRSLDPTVVEARIDFRCYKVGGTYCDAYFDDVTLVGTYGGA